MIKTVKYRGFTMSPPKFNLESQDFSAKIAGIDEEILFRAGSTQELIETFQKAVDEYVDKCEKKGVKPSKPFNGVILVRLNPEEHRQIFLSASRHNKSLNQFVKEAALKEIQRKNNI